ncbi:MULTISPECIES: hypothetical protein [unclassified Caulobacter]|uniref:hypothetical protein n=1 Tax=unclassified Caulobacter TaxID=2648921 RepID=UPI0006F8602F|nr:MULTISPECIES: hypothetical protein [unclassified Caulobacter]KQV62098.1 hypothetical protein ASC62_00755 [Caulobacter sp. Root342]KQV64690.1 hypothetical protein ASC70_18665 [Caulobacter sp. Root343]
MNRQKIIFLIVLGAAGLFIVSMVGSMMPSKQVLPNGYQMSVGGKGETWMRSPDRQVLVTDVTSVWTSAGQMLVERHTTEDKLADCDYQVADGRGALRPVSKAEAQVLLAGMERQAASSKTCVK